jgi:hypothetical protein
MACCQSKLRSHIGVWAPICSAGPRETAHTAPRSAPSIPTGEHAVQTAASMLGSRLSMLQLCVRSVHSVVQYSTQKGSVPGTFYSAGNYSNWVQGTGAGVLSITQTQTLKMRCLLHCSQQCGVHPAVRQCVQRGHMLCALPAQ